MPFKRLPCIGDPPGAPCETIGLDGLVHQKISLACALGEFVQAALVTLLAGTYEVMGTLRGLLITFSTPSYSTSIRVPTFASSLKDLEVALCAVFYFAASLVPVTFSCNAQLEGAPDPSAYSTAPSTFNLEFWGETLGLPPLATRLPNDDVCIFNRTAWAGSMASCNCSDTVYTTQTIETLLTSASSPACVLQCMPDLIAYPLRIGSPYVPSAITSPGARATAVRFSNASTLNSFLTTALFPLSGLIVLPTLTDSGVTLVDPSPTDNTYFGGEWVAELLTGIVNDRLLLTYGRRFPTIYASLVVNPLYQGCTDYFELAKYNSNATIATAFSAFLAALDTLPVHDYMAALSLFVIGASSFDPATFLSRVSIPIIFPGLNPTSGVAIMANAISDLFGVVIPTNNLTMANDLYRTLIGPVRKFNNARVNSCGNTWFAENTTCLYAANIELAERSGPVQPSLDISLTAPLNTGNPVYCTYQPTDYANTNYTGCDCTGNHSYTYYLNGGSVDSPRCAMFCDPPSFPVLMGASPGDCYVPGLCSKTTARTVDSLAALAAEVGTIPNASALDFRQTTIGTTAPQIVPEFARNFFTAAMNLRFMRRYNPTRFLYMRTMDDPLYGGSCIADDQDRLLWSGVNLETLLQVINVTYFGDVRSGNHTGCENFFPVTTTTYSTCIRLVSFYPQLFGSTWGQHMRDHILPILQLINNYRPNCATGHNCFVYTSYEAGGIGTSLPGSLFVPGEFGNPPLIFTLPQYATLPASTVQNMPRCGSTISCFGRTGCTLGRFVLTPFQLVSAILDQINQAISGGAGQWTLGNGLWDLLKVIVIQLSQRFFDFILAFANSLDCVVCAIIGNVPGDLLCQAPLYQLLHQLLVVFDLLVVTIVSFVIDLIRTVVLFFFYLFTGQWALLGDLLLSFLTEIVNFLYNLLQIIVGFILGSACLCVLFVGFFNWPSPCSNADYCPTHKRDISVAATTTAQVNFTYQLFAADWPVPNAAGYVWPSGDWCQARMATLAAAGGPSGPGADADDATYCLAKLTILPTVETDLGAGQTDACARVLESMAAQPATPFGSFDLTTRATALECIGKFGLAYAMRNGAAPGTMDWVPSYAFTAASNPLVSWAPTIVRGIHGANAQSERWRDAHYTAVVLASPEYQSSLLNAYGPARVALVQRTLDNGGVPPPIDDYVAAMYPSDRSPTSRKRGVSAAGGGGDEGTLSLGRLFSLATDRVRTDLVPTVFQTMDARTASLPPVLRLIDGRDTATTAAQLRDEGQSFGETAAMVRVAPTMVGRIINSGYSLGRNIYVTGSTLSSVQAEMANTFAASKKRGVVYPPVRFYYTARQSPIVRRAALESGSLMGVPSVAMNILRQGLNGMLNISHDMWTGRAHLNATNTDTRNPIVTTVQFQLANRQPAPGTGTTPGIQQQLAASFLQSPSAASLPPDVKAVLMAAATPPAPPPTRWDRFLGPQFTARIATTYSSVWSLMQKMVATTNVASIPLHERSRRLGIVWHATRAALENVTALFTQSVGASDIDPNACYSTELCQQCYFVDQLFGYWLLFIATAIHFYTGVGGARFEASLPYMQADFIALRDRLQDPNAVAFFGDSALNPARWPYRTRSNWGIFGDTLPNKLRFSDLQDLVDTTSNFFLDLFVNYDYFNPNPLAVTTIASTTNVSAATANFQTAAYRAGIPKALPHGTWSTLDVFGGLMSLVLPSPASVRDNLVASGTFSVPLPVLGITLRGNLTMMVEARDRVRSSSTGSDLFALAKAWAEWIYDQFFYCGWGREFDGSLVRFSLGEILIGVGAIVALFIVVAAAFPEVTSVLGTTGGMVGIVIVLGTAFSLATGWSLFCFTAFPPIVLTHMLPHFLTDQILPECPLPLSGLINEPDYDNTNCNSCPRWQGGTFTVPNCARNLGWQYPTDVIVFLLQQLAPSWLASLQDATQWPFPISTLLGSATAQLYLHHWDGVDVSGNDVVFSQQWTCAIGVILLVTIGLLAVIIVLLTLSPVQAAIRAAFRLFAWLLMTGVQFTIAFIAGPMFATVGAPMKIINKYSVTLRDLQ